MTEETLVGRGAERFPVDPLTFHSGLEQSGNRGAEEIRMRASRTLTDERGEPGGLERRDDLVPDLERFQSDRGADRRDQISRRGAPAAEGVDRGAGDVGDDSSPAGYLADFVGRAGGSCYSRLISRTYAPAC